MVEDTTTKRRGKTKVAREPFRRIGRGLSVRHQSLRHPVSQPNSQSLMQDMGCGKKAEEQRANRIIAATATPASPFPFSTNTMSRRILLFFLCHAILLPIVESLRSDMVSLRQSPPSPVIRLTAPPNRSGMRPHASPRQDDDDNVVELGSKEYIQGMVTRSVDEESEERVTGDKVLGPTLRLAGGVTAVLVGLVAAFLFSNGIITI